MDLIGAKSHLLALKAKSPTMVRPGFVLIKKGPEPAEKTGMSASVRKFVARAPRYTLRPTDNRIMRFAHEGEKGQAFATRILDISLSGVSFVVDRDQAPFIQDAIKLEIPLDGGEQFAWWGRVVRMEEYAPHKWYLKKEDFDSAHQIMVAVRFEGLPSTHVQKIQKTLNKKFEEVRAEKKREAWKSLASLWATYTWELIFYFGIVLTAIYILWALSRPSANYDAEKGAPWGQRMWYINR